MIQDAHDIFLTTLANMNRLRIINALRERELNVTEISKSAGMNQTTASHNLKRLLESGFVNARQQGQHRYYALNNKTIRPLMDLIDRHIRTNCQHLITKPGGG